MTNQTAGSPQARRAPRGHRSALLLTLALALVGGAIASGLISGPSAHVHVLEGGSTHHRHGHLGEHRHEGDPAPSDDDESESGADDAWIAAGVAGLELEDGIAVPTSRSRPDQWKSPPDTGVANRFDRLPPPGRAPPSFRRS